MASLMQIAKEQAENLRAGTVWVIVWKIGRSWQAKAVSLNPKTRTWGSAEEQKRASEILDLDRNAVVVQGETCYCPGKKPFIEELAKEIREKYEFGVHLLRRVLQIFTVPEPATAEPDRETAAEQKETAEDSNFQELEHLVSVTAAEQIDAAPWMEHVKHLEKALAQWEERWEKRWAMIKNRFPELFPVGDTGDDSSPIPTGSGYSADREKDGVSLMQIAQEQAENLRAGTVWVIVWKIGRSWQAEAVSLNPKTRTWGSMEDKKRASEIMKLDSQAVVCSGRNCGLSGEKYATGEIAEQIRWQYKYNVISLRYVLQILAVPKAETTAGKRTANRARPPPNHEKL